MRAKTADHARTRAAIYLRAHAQDAVEGLNREVSDYAESRGFMVVRSYTDICNGGRVRSSLPALLRDSRKRRFSLIVFMSLSDLRGHGEALKILRGIREAGCAWHFVRQPELNFDGGKDSAKADGMLSLMSALEADKQDREGRRAQSIRAALAERKARGIMLGRHPAMCSCGKHDKHPQVESVGRETT
jgi:hypothetical protein